MSNSILLSMMIPMVCVAADPTPSGNEFQVNTTTLEDQKKASVAIADDGSFIVVWESKDANDDKNVFGQRYDASGSAVGGEFQVNPNVAGDQKAPVTVMTPSGGSLVVWEDRSARQIMGERFDSSGATVGSKFNITSTTDFLVGFDTAFGSSQASVRGIQIATQTTLQTAGQVNGITAYIGGSYKKVRYALYSDSGGEPGALIAETATKEADNVEEWFTIDLPATTLSAGTYWLALTFEDQNQYYHYTSGGQTRYRNLDAVTLGYASSWGVSDNSFARQITIFADFSDDAKKPALAMRDDGGYVVTWESLDADKKGVFAKRFDSSDNAVGGSFSVNTTTSGDQKKQDIAMSGAGSFVVVWENKSVTNEKDVFGQRYDALGNRLGGEFQINTTTLGDQKGPRVAMADDSSFVVVWEGPDISGKGVFGQRFDASGNPLGGEFQVNVTTLNDQKKPKVAMEGDGSFVVVWESADADKKGVFGRQYDSSGSPVSGEFQVNTTTLGDQKGPNIAAASGRFVVVWEAPDANKKGVFGQLYGLGKLVLKNWSTQGSLDRQAKNRTMKQAAGWAAPQKDLAHLQQVNQN